MQRTKCPTHDALAAFLTGKFDEVTIEAIASHLEACQPCQRLVERIEQNDDSLAARLRPTAVPHCVPEACERMMRAAEAVFPEQDTREACDPQQVTAPRVNELTQVSRGGDVADRHAANEATWTCAKDSSSMSGHRFWPGERFGDYEIEREIARGGMGVVFQARQISLNRPVALKMILSARLASAEDVVRFQSEAEAAARLSHPGIVPIFEVGEHGGQHFFSMRLIDGDSLSALVKDGPLAPRRAAELVRKVAQAVHYAHSRNIVHRDLKPANVLLDASGDPQVTDFGLAKDVTKNSGLTQSGQVMGTPSYMPPEQASGRMAEVGPLADVYSLGAILYFLLTAHPPFRGDTVVNTIQLVLNAEPISARQRNPQISLDLASVCAKCLEKDPAQRYASAAELADDLQRYLRGEPLLARPLATADRVWRWCRRNPKVLSLSAAAMLILAAVVLTTGLGLNREVRTLQTRLDAVADRAVADTAQWVAMTAELELRERYGHVRSAAESPVLRDALAELVSDPAYYAEAQSQLKQWDTAARQSGVAVAALPPQLRPLQAWLADNPQWMDSGQASQADRFGPALIGASAEKPTENVLGWFVCGPDGTQLARDPISPSENRRFCFRSYFTGRPTDISPTDPCPNPVWQAGDLPRLSAVFRTEETNFWVLALSAPVWDADGRRLLGVVGQFIPLGRFLEQPPAVAHADPAQRAARFAILLDPRPGANRAAIVGHPFHRFAAAHDPASGRLRADVVEQTIDLTRWTGDDLADPFADGRFGAEAAAQFGGRWRASKAKVQLPGQTEQHLVAVVCEAQDLLSEPSQRLQRNLVVLGLSAAGLAVLVLAAIGMLVARRFASFDVVTGH